MIRVLASQCLTGEACRYDGASRPCPALEALPAGWSVIQLCPETGVGMGTPRNPLSLVANSGQIRMLDRVTGADWTGRMKDWCEAQLRTLGEQGLHGAILKARSPSCGSADAEVYCSQSAFEQHARLSPGELPAAIVRPSNIATADGDGLLVASLRRTLPGLPLISEEQLVQAGPRRDFVARVEAFALDPQGRLSPASR